MHDSTTIAQLAFALVFLVVAVSHAAHPERWHAFFRDLATRDYAAFIIVLYTAPVGLLILLTHNRWVLDLPVIVTLTGWGMCIKSAVYLLFPHLPYRAISTTSPVRFRTAGIVAGAIFIPVAIDALLVLSRPAS